MAARHHRIVVTCLFLATSYAQAVRAQAPAPAVVPDKTFEIVASRFKFAPSVIEVTEGERVLLKLRSADGKHGLGIKDFKVKRQIPKTGDTVSVEFVADRAGTFTILCSEYCGGGHSRMKGQLVVHPKAN